MSGRKVINWRLSFTKLLSYFRKRKSRPDFARFLQMAFGSVCELENLLMLSHEIRYLHAAQYEQLSRDEVEAKKMLIFFLQKQKADS